MQLSPGIEIPDTVRVAGNEIKIILEDKVPDNNYGYWSDVTNTIHLARTIEEKYAGVVTLTPNQIRNTYYHELMHVFQFYYNNRTDEGQAQVYANFICEYLDSINKPF